MQEALGLGAIGGKDSMSGTFNDIHVPPTLVSFAIAPGKASEAVSQELKKEGDVLVLFGMPKDKEGMPDLDVFKKHADFLYQEVKAGHVAAMKAVDHGGVAVTAAKMAFGNGLGIHFTENLPLPKFFGNFYGAIIVETTAEEAQRFAKEPHTKILGTIGGDTMELYGESIALSDLLSAYENRWISSSRGGRKALISLLRCCRKQRLFPSSMSIPTSPDPGYSFLPCPATTAKWTVPEPLNGPAPFPIFHL